MKLLCLLPLIALAACGGSGNESAAPAAEASAPVAAQASDPTSVPSEPKVTLAKAALLKPGMTYDEVKALLGRPGYPSARDGGSAIYAWANTDGSSLQVTFRDEKMVDTIDFGMK